MVWWRRRVMHRHGCKMRSLLLLLLLLLSRQRKAMELRLSLLLCRQWETVKWWLGGLMMVVILRPAVGDIANMGRLWTLRCHLLGCLSP